MRIIKVFLLTLSLMFAAIMPTASQDERPRSTITSAAWSPDGSRIAIGSNDGFLRIWDTDGQVLVDFSDITDTVRSVDWSPDGSKIVSGGNDGLVNIWDANTGELSATLRGHDDVIQSVDWSDDGAKIASTSFNDLANLRIWNAENYDLSASLVAGMLFDASWSPDSTQLAIAQENGYAVVLDSNLNQIFSFLPIKTGLVDVIWTPNGDYIIGGDASGQIHLWDTKTKLETTTIKAHEGVVTAINLDPGGNRLVSVGQGDGKLKIWNIETFNIIETFSIEKEITLFSVDWSPDGTQLAYGGASGELHIMDTASSEITPEPS